jgi:hypothetical protein
MKEAASICTEMSRYYCRARLIGSTMLRLHAEKGCTFYRLSDYGEQEQQGGKIM